MSRSSPNPKSYSGACVRPLPLERRRPIGQRRGARGSQQRRRGRRGGAVGGRRSRRPKQRRPRTRHEPYGVGGAPASGQRCVHGQPQQQPQQRRPREQPRRRPAERAGMPRRAVPILPRVQRPGADRSGARARGCGAPPRARGPAPGPLLPRPLAAHAAARAHPAAAHPRRLKHCPPADRAPLCGLGSGPTWGRRSRVFCCSGARPGATA
jgi:hypothetical protein